MNNKTTTLWYIRHNDHISGPFSASAIRNNLILGRLSQFDEVSKDKQSWYLILNHPQLQINLDADALEKAQRNLDERNGFDRRDKTNPPKEIINKRKGDRRTRENGDDIMRRQLRTRLMQKYRERKEKMFWPLLATFSMIMIVTALAIFYPSKLQVPLANCFSQPSPGINWDNCPKPQFDMFGVDLSAASLRNITLTDANLMNAVLSGADLAYANLQSANLSYTQLENATLIGVDLKQADLSYADLTNADLSYADLREAKIGGTKLDGARLDRTIWINGQLCARGSVGSCIPEQP